MMSSTSDARHTEHFPARNPNPRGAGLTRGLLRGVLFGSFRAVIGCCLRAWNLGAPHGQQFAIAMESSVRYSTLVRVPGQFVGSGR